MLGVEPRRKGATAHKTGSLIYCDQEGWRKRKGARRERSRGAKRKRVQCLPVRKAYLQSVQGAIEAWAKGSSLGIKTSKADTHLYGWSQVQCASSHPEARGWTWTEAQSRLWVIHRWRIAFRRVKITPKRSKVRLAFSLSDIHFALNKEQKATYSPGCESTWEGWDEMTKTSIVVSVSLH